MKCKEIQNLILTDYMDKELSDDQCLMIEDHLSHCQECQELIQTARVMNEEFAKAREVDLDQEKIWQNITEEIKQEQASSIIYTPVAEGLSLKDKMRRLFKPSLAWVTLTGVILIFSLYLQPKNNTIVQESKNGEIQYLASLEEELYDDQVDGLDGSVDIAIEEYFL